MNAVVIENLLGANAQAAVLNSLATPQLAFSYEHTGIWPGEPTFIMSHPLYGSGAALSPLYPLTEMMACVGMDRMEWASAPEMIESQYFDQLPPKSDRAWFDHRWGGTNLAVYMINTTGARLEIYDQTIHDDVKVPLTLMSSHDFVANTWVMVPSAHRYSVVADPAVTWTSFVTTAVHNRWDRPKQDK